jgi:hypothetical protein
MSLMPIRSLSQITNQLLHRMAQTCKCVRKIYSIPNGTHNKLVALICNDVDPEEQLYTQFFRFFLTAMSSQNRLVQLGTRLALNGRLVCMNKADQQSLREQGS